MDGAGAVAAAASAAEVVVCARTDLAKRRVYTKGATYLTLTLDLGCASSYTPLEGEDKAKTMALARADLESLLRARRLDRTLPTILDARDETALAPSGVSSLDAHLGGGLPRGHVSEIVGVRSAGRTSLLLRSMAAATARGELVALVDALDMFDVESAVAAGIDLEHVLW